MNVSSMGRVDGVGSGPVYYPEDEMAYLQAPAIRDLKEIDRLEPADPYQDGNLPAHLEGKTMTLHICGKTNKIWEAMADTGADCLSLDDLIDLISPAAG